MDKMPTTGERLIAILHQTASVKELLSMDNFSKLPPESQQKLLHLLPHVCMRTEFSDTGGNTDMVHENRSAQKLSFARGDALTNEFFNTSCADFMNRFERCEITSKTFDVPHSIPTKAAESSAISLKPLLSAGDVVWCKFQTCRWWPGLVVDVKHPAVPEAMLLCALIHRAENGWLPCQHVASFGNGRKSKLVLKNLKLSKCSSPEERDAVCNDFEEPVDTWLDSQIANSTAERYLKLSPKSRLREIKRLHRFTTLSSILTAQGQTLENIIDSTVALPGSTDDPKSVLADPECKLALPVSEADADSALADSMPALPVSENDPESALADTESKLALPDSEADRKAAASNTMAKFTRIFNSISDDLTELTSDGQTRGFITINVPPDLQKIYGSTVWIGNEKDYQHVKGAFERLQPGEQKKLSCDWFKKTYGRKNNTDSC